MDTQNLGAAFQPVRVVTPPTVTDKFVSESNKPYIDALVGMQTIAAQAASATPGAAEALLGQTMERTGAARVAVAQLAQKFRVDGAAAEVGQAVRKLISS